MHSLTGTFLDFVPDRWPVVRNGAVRRHDAPAVDPATGDGRLLGRHGTGATLLPRGRRLIGGAGEFTVTTPSTRVVCAVQIDR